MSEADSVPVNEDHHGVFREPGNIYNREYTAWYDSDVFDCGKSYDFTKNGKLTYIGYEPEMSYIWFYTRSGPDSVVGPGWTKWNKVVNGHADPNSLRWRYVQYRAEFKYPKPTDLPWLERVNIRFYPLDFELLFYPDSVKSASQGSYVDYPLTLFYLGDEDDSFYMALREPPFKEGWRIELWDTAFTDTIPWYIKLREMIPHGVDTNFVARIYPAEDAQVGDTNVTTIYTHTRWCSRDMDDSVSLYTAVVAPGVYESWITQPAQLEVTSIGREGLVRFATPAGGIAQLEVYDASGRRVYTQTVTGAGNIQWSDHATAAGLYFIRIKLPDQTIVRKTVLTR
jgi:hypothetical protein